MRRLLVTTFAAGLLLSVCGCTGVRRAEEVSLPAGPAAEQSLKVETTPQKGSPPAPCLEGHGFAVFGLRAVRDIYSRVSVIGEVKNIGTAARGVELQASLRDATGRLLAVGHLCPASNRNIVPGESWPFTYSFGVQGDAAQAELRIVGAFRTTGILNTP
jgi:hypothetical protein